MSPPQSPMRDVFTGQKKAFAKNTFPSIAERKKDLNLLLNIVSANHNRFADAINTDFSGRSKAETMTLEVMQTQHKIKFVIRNLKRWMRPEKRTAGLLYMPASAKVFFQPLGVIGVVSPWNYPLVLSLAPVAYALAAGNRVMLKPSENTPHTSALLAKLLGDVFPEDKVAVIIGGAEEGAEFSTLPFDHLFFTGSTKVGRLVMQGAATNLTPVTLELGGKSPCIIGEEANISEAASRICFGKSINAGQTCIAPDYILLRRGKEDEFAKQYIRNWKRMYPEGIESDDYSSIVNDDHFNRLNDMLNEARESGARIEVVCQSAKWEKGADNKMPTHLIFIEEKELQVMKEEIFGPLLPVVLYDELDEAIELINSGNRPLALYYFGDKRVAKKKILRQTHSGGVVFNDTVIQFAITSLPFGGVGSSGIGSYYGREGFLRFSHQRSVVSKGRINPTRLAYPPYGRRAE